jgi:very-short-patch-repair endonuclease
MSMRFGPLGQKGGERRLNVAITRAKQNIKLVSSIMPSDINLGKTESEGVRMLRSYIEFAISGSDTLHTAHNADDNDAFVDVVYEFLSSKGYKIKKYLGCSEYKIDIAIMHSEIENCFVAGVECDGFSYSVAKTARDRDHLRKSILQSMGWNIYRVWSTEWIERTESEKQKLLAFIENSIANYTIEPLAEEAQPTKAYENTEDLTEHFYEDVFDDSQDQENPFITESSNPYGFEDYVEANWRDAPRNSAGKITDSDALKYIVGVEQPISIDLLYQRMAKAYGQQKATVKIRNNVNTLMNYRDNKELFHIDTEGFVTLTGFADLKVRIPAEESTPRQIQHISSDEIGLAMKIIASHAIGISIGDLIDATVRTLGYARKGERVMSCMKKSFDNLVEDGCVKVIDNKVSVV